MWAFGSLQNVLLVAEVRARRTGGAEIDLPRPSTILASSSEWPAHLVRLSD
jgi:hypothetical protein